MISLKLGSAAIARLAPRLLLASFIGSLCAMAQAEIVIPNPLIKPQQITPMAENAPEKNKALALPVPGEAMALPRLPSSGAPGVPAPADADTLRSTLSAYQVVLLAPTHAILKLSVRQGASGTDSGSAGQTTRRSLGSTLAIRNNGAMRLMGESLRSRIVGDTVEIVRHSTVGGFEDIVFMGSLETSATAPYVPEASKMEKVDSQYRRSLLPEIRSSSSGGSNGSGGNNGSNGGNTSSQGSTSSPSQ